jgi:hypothetical protein
MFYGDVQLDGGAASQQSHWYAAANTITNEEIEQILR